MPVTERFSIDAEVMVSSAQQATRAPRRALFGRDRELAELRAGVADAIAGRGRLVLLVGDAGIGKSRLAAELAARAGTLGARVFWGRCWEAGGAPAYWPWIQILRACLRSQDSPAVESRIGLGAASIAELVPEIGKQRTPRAPSSGDPDHEHARFYLFDAVTSFLKGLAASQPVVLILDDLHAADEASLLLLRFFAQEIHDSRLLVIAAYREHEARSRARFVELFRLLSRQGSRIPLSGLNEAEVRSFIEQTVGSAVPAALVAEVHRATEGNPFFVDEIVRLLAAEERVDETRRGTLRIPESIHETIRRRLQSLSEECGDLLAVASAVGRDFNVAVLAQVARLPVEQTFERLAEAVQAGTVTPVPGAVGRYSFGHALVRETFYADLPRARRHEIHRRIAESLESIHAGDLEPHFAVIAHHYFHAAPGGDSRPAVRYARLAGQRAMRLLAFEEAVLQFRRAAEVLALEAKSDGAERCEVLLALGEAQRKAGDVAAAAQNFTRAAEAARSVGAKEMFARAALGYSGGLGGMGYGDRADDERVARLEEALDWLGGDDSVLRVHCLARLAGELYYTDFVERRRALGEQAVAMAERTGDLGAQVVALHSRHCSLWGPDSDLEEQRRGASEILRLAERIADREMMFRGHQLRLSSELASGDLAAVDREIEACATLAADLRQPVYLWQVAVCRAMRALLSGRLEDAERLSQEALELGQQGYENAARSFFGAQMANLCWMQGRLAAIEPIVVNFVGKEPRVPAWRAGLAFLYAELGRTAEARAEFEVLARNDFTGIPRDGTWIDTIYILSLVCSFLNDSGRAAVLHRLLSPYVERNATVTGTVVCFGPVALAIGALATTLGRWQEAEHLLATARERAAAMNARPYESFARVHLAMLCLARRRPGDLAEARRWLEPALADVEELRAQGLVQKAKALLDSIGDAHDAGSLPIGESSQEGRLPETFRREGDLWTIAYESRSFRLRDAKGLQYLARLLRHPGEKFHVSDLAGATGSHDSRGSTLDDIETVERLRKAVANSIRYAIARIEKESPALGLHLTNAVRTGAACFYLPDRMPPWRF